MTAWHVLEWLLVAVVIGAATWQVARHFSRTRSARGAACGGCNAGSACSPETR